MAPETPPTGGMSSRLLTMKFMQRAASATSPASSASPSEHSSKRRKLGSAQSSRTYEAPDQAAVRLAVQEREEKRREAFQKHITDPVDTEWVLDSTKSRLNSAAPKTTRNVVYVGYAEIDAADETKSEANQAKAGRKRIGNYKATDDPQSSSDEDKGKSKKRQRYKEDSEAAREREQRIDKSLSSMTSISSGGPAVIQCKYCGLNGHNRKDCPRRRKQQESTRA